MLKIANTSQIVLERAPLEPNGAMKTDVNTATVRVYLVVAGSEVDALASTALVNVRDNIWRYIWEPASIAAGQYRIEYTFDDTVITTNDQEDLEVLDMPTATALASLQSDVTDCVDELQGNEIVDATGLCTKYRADDYDAPTELRQFQYNDVAGDPATSSIFQRIRLEP